MRPNKLKTIWQSGGTVLNGWLHIPSGWSAELMAHAGWDSCTVDMQHGLHSMERAIQLLQAISTTDTVPLARVNWNEPGAIMRLLDGGAYGIICPMVNTAAECRAFVGACRYPPTGYRSYGPTRARVYAGAGYDQHANRELLAIAMVETREALAHLDEIAAVEGLDGIFVGSGDLSLSLMGSVAGGSGDERMEEALTTILAACRKYNLVPGIFSTSVANATAMIEKGFRFITLKSDSVILSEYATRLVTELRTSGPFVANGPSPSKDSS
ncbi:MAG TPA: aldolase/citrate lyase family protein [Spirosoma sp.]|nr:aldolase/citrate lyase family protein [Spirosoma sp.]